jgi:hypothetical protein
MIFWRFCIPDASALDSLLIQLVVPPDGLVRPKTFTRRNFMIMWPCIETFLYNKTNRRTNLPKFIYVKKLYMFRAVPLPIIRSFPLYIRHWYMPCKFDDSFQARPSVVLESVAQGKKTFKKNYLINELRVSKSRMVSSRCTWVSSSFIICPWWFSIGH